MFCPVDTIILSAAMSLIVVLFVNVCTFNARTTIEGVILRFIAKTFAAMFSITLLQASGYLDVHDLIPVFTLLTYDQFITTYIIPVAITTTLFAGAILERVTSPRRITDHPILSTSKHEKYGYLIFAPITEEFIYRTLMLNLLLRCYSPSAAAIISSAFFSISHSHYHYGFLVSQGRWYWLIFIYHLLFTLVFGLYSSMIYIRVQSAFCTTIIHSFFNWMGLIRVERIFKQWPLCLINLVGIIGSMVSLYVFLSNTNHHL